MKIILSLLLSMSLFTSCKQSDGVGTIEEKHLSAQTIKDVSYGKDTAQRMDIYLPEGRSIDSTRVIVLIHGGGWNSGNKTDCTSYIDSFKRRMPDYAIFNLNYRLFNGENLFPTQEKDVKSAIDFITAKAREYHINKDKLVLLGASAGAHLALLQAYKYNDPRIKAVIDYFGPSDLTLMYQQPWHPLVNYALKMITGTTPAENEELYYQSSPVNFIKSNSAPTLIFHGSNDQIVDISQSKFLKTKLENSNVPHELVIYRGQGHGWQGATLVDSFDRIELFLKKYVE
jgi:acetyl esterase/lipase